MTDRQLNDLIEAIHTSDRKLVLAVTGGGASVISKLLAQPGASRLLLEAVVPYAAGSLHSWLGGEPDQACSESTARAMAMSAWARARRLAPAADPAQLIGLGCTASIATDRPKRGAHRIFIAVQTSVCTNSYSCVLAAKDRSRDEEESLAATIALMALARRCGVDVSAFQSHLQSALGSDEPIARRGAVAEPAWTELLLSERKWAAERPRSVQAEMDADAARPQGLLFPGAFDPLHEGHLRMAAIAEAKLGRPAAWEIAVANVDKPMLDFVAIHDRVQALRWADEERVILLTAAPTFREKARLFPESTFVVGIDTIVRIAAPRYYGGEAQLRDDALRSIADQGCRFLVYGRLLDGEFRSLSDIDLPDQLVEICDEVADIEFREDVSSTELRRRERAAADDATTTDPAATPNEN